MKFLKRFFSPKKDPENQLYKKVNFGFFLTYEESHEKEEIQQSEKDRIKSAIKYNIFGVNSKSFVTIAKKNRLGGYDDQIFQIQKYKDEWFTVFISELDLTKRANFSVKEEYLCDTLDGVISLIRKFYKS